MRKIMIRLPTIQSTSTNHNKIIKYYNSTDGVTNVNFTTDNMVRTNSWQNRGSNQFEHNTNQH